MKSLAEASGCYRLLSPASVSACSLARRSVRALERHGY
jgi:hypothetical protein